MKARNNTQTINKFKVIFSAVSWGTMGLFVRLINLPTSLIACFRGLIGALFLYLLGACITKNLKLDFAAIKKNWAILLLSGFALGINWIFLFESYRRTSIAISTLCYYLAPVIVIIASVILFHEKLTLPKIACIVTAIIGMIFISGILSSNLGGGYGVVGMLMALAAAFFYATVTVLGKKTEGLSANQETIVKLLVAAVILIPYNFFTVSIDSIKPTPLMIFLVIVLGIVHTGGAFATYFSAIHHLDAQLVAILTYLDPIVAIFVSTFILKEGLDIMGIIGAVLLLGSLICFDTICSS